MYTAVVNALKAVGRFMKNESRSIFPYLVGLAIVVVVSSLVFAKMYFSAQKELLGVAGDALEGMFPTNVELKYLVYNEIGHIQRESKHVVYSAQVSVSRTIIADVSRTLWPDSHSRVRITLYSNRVQYVITTDDLTNSDFTYFRKRHELYISIPSPHIDMEIVEVQSNPNMIDIQEDSGIFHPADVDFLRDNLLANIRADVLVAGSQEILLQEAARAAEDEIQELFQIPLTMAGYDIEVIVMVEEDFNYPEYVHHDELAHL